MEGEESTDAEDSEIMPQGEHVLVYFYIVQCLSFSSSEVCLRLPLSSAITLFVSGLHFLGCWLCLALTHSSCQRNEAHSGQ